LRVVVAAAVAVLLIVAVVRAAAVVDSSCRGRSRGLVGTLLWEYDAKTFIILQSFPIANHYFLYGKTVPCGFIWTDA